MKWLQWSTADLAHGLGGVEVHARSVARELERRWIECRISRDLADFDKDWDVILTHGSAAGPHGSPRVARVHVLHGTSLGRMTACNEWAWAGGYFAEAREIRGTLQADVVLTVNPRLSLFHLACALGKVAAFCGNGWDAADESREVRRVESLEKSWLYIGRGEDRVKGADRVSEALRKDSQLRVFAAPGTGFEGFSESESNLVRTGLLDSAQVRFLLQRARGLLLPSRYEGNSLVMLESLSLGLPVVTTEVGGATFFPAQELQGLKVLHSESPETLIQAIREAERDFPADPVSRAERARVNQKLLPRWSDVVDVMMKSVEEFRRSG